MNYAAHFQWWKFSEQGFHNDMANLQEILWDLLFIYLQIVFCLIEEIHKARRWVILIFRHCFFDWQSRELTGTINTLRNLTFTQMKSFKTFRTFSRILVYFFKHLTWTSVEAPQQTEPICKLSNSATSSSESNKASTRRVERVKKIIELKTNLTFLTL